MGEHAIKLSDVGEGITEAEVVEWHVKPGDVVREDDVLAAVMTDKVTVEISSPVQGKVIWVGAAIGDTVAVGSELLRLEVSGEGNVPAGAPDLASQPNPAPELTPQAAHAPVHAAEFAIEPVIEPEPKSDRAASAATRPSSVPRPSGRPPRPEGEKPLAAPSVRRRARDGGVDLRQVPGTGPAGRITHADLDAFFRQGAAPGASPSLVADTSVTEIKIAGLRRRIAEKMALSTSRIAHFTIVEEVDVTALEELRARLNATKRDDRAKLTLLPFIMRAMVKALAKQPELNAHYDDEAGIVRQFGGVHLGIATQTASGLLVPVVQHSEARDLWNCAHEVARLAAAARSGRATREDLSGSTITITSLGPLGAIATTPVINHPEVAIVGINKIVVRPVWDGAQFVPRKMMNLSCSFDHRVVDGWDAAVFVQELKTLLETPAMMFVEG